MKPKPPVVPLSAMLVSAAHESLTPWMARELRRRRSKSYAPAFLRSTRRARPGYRVSALWLDDKECSFNRNTYITFCDSMEGTKQGNVGPGGWPDKGGHPAGTREGADDDTDLT